MNVHISYKMAKAPDVEREFSQHLQKLERRVRVYRPELVHLHAIVDQNSSRGEMMVSLNLRLPSGQMAASESGPNAVAAVKRSFAELIKQLDKHKDQLRGQQHRREAKHPREKVAFEETIAAVHPPVASVADIREFINANLDRLQRFIDREIRYRISAGSLEPDEVTPEEALDEAVSAALDDTQEKPELLSLERWMYGLALRAIESTRHENGEAPPETVHFEESVRKQNVRASDEPELQYHQPDETLTEESVIPDRSMATPEEIAASDEMVTMVEAALLGTKKEDREAFILHGIEGFTVEEISAATRRRPDEVKASIISAREHLKKHLPRPNPLEEHLLRASKIA
jgi:DNA-directed RNA polymerase specialized sigma24 family protein